jgi:hypothetical protein
MEIEARWFSTSLTLGPTKPVPIRPVNERNRRQDQVGKRIFEYGGGLWFSRVFGSSLPLN